jgi:hypothetical protein
VSSAIAGNPTAAASAVALIRAFSSRVVPVSSTSGSAASVGSAAADAATASGRSSRNPIVTLLTSIA